MKRQTDKRKALLAAVCADPDNDAPRLAFADWLDKNGQPAWAALIRKQIALGGQPEFAPEHVRGRCSHYPESFSKEVRDEASRDFPPGFAWIGANNPFERGFPGHVQTTVETFLAHADRLFAVAPVRELELLNTSAGDLARLADSPYLARLRSLSLRAYKLDVDSYRRLGESPHTAGLRCLRLSEGYSRADDALVLLETPLFGRLNEFEWYWGFGGIPGDRFAKEFARLGPTQLTVLRPRVGLSSAGVVRLVQARAAGSLTALEIADAHAREDAVRVLATSPQLAGLRSLSVCRTVTKLATLKVLLEGAVWRLRHLDLRWGQLGAQAIKALVKSPVAAELTALELCDNPIGDGGANTLAASPTSARLLYLDLEKCKIGDAGGLALAESPHLEGLLHLGLHENTFSDPVNRALRDRFGERVSLDWRSQGG